MENQKETPSHNELENQENISNEVADSSTISEEKISVKTEELLEEIIEDGKQVTEYVEKTAEVVAEEASAVGEEKVEAPKKTAEVVAEEASAVVEEKMEAPEETVEVVAEEASAIVEEKVEAPEETAEVVAEEASAVVEEKVEAPKKTAEVVAEEASAVVEEKMEAPEETVEVVAEEASAVVEEKMEAPEETVEVVAEEASAIVEEKVEAPEETAEVVAEEASAVVEEKVEAPEETAEVVAEEASAVVEEKMEAPEETAEVVAEEASAVVEEKMEAPEETAEVVAEEASAVVEETIETVAEETAEVVEEKVVSEDPIEVDLSPEPEAKPIDYTTLDLPALLAIFESTSINGDLNKERDNLENMKHLLNVKFSEDRKDRFKVHASKGKSSEDFDYETAELKTFKESMARIGKRRSQIRKDQEEKRGSAIKKRALILDSMKQLVDGDNILDHSKKFRDLQSEWRSISNLPSDDMKTAWDRFHVYSDKFYNALKINRQLREMDFQRNMKSKLAICEQAEELLLMNNLNEQVKALHVLHSRWKEIGPVLNEKREELWDRFKLSSEKIHEKRREFFEEQEGNREANLTSKTKFCEDAEKLLEESPEKHGEWQKLTEKFLALQEQWRKVGPVPREVSEEMWQRFKGACDIFFTRKSEFYKHYRDAQQQNMHLKLDLIGQAEVLAESTNWKKTSTDLINLQKEWKKVGPVPRKHSDKLWAQFREACDTFFNSKKVYFESMDDRYEDNLKSKLELIDQIEGFNLSKDQSENMDALKSFQSKWMQIGYVPMKEKEQVFEKYRNSINKIFDALELSKDERSELKFQNKVDQLRKEEGGNDAIRRERNALKTQISKLQSEISLLENNIEFFSNSSNSQELRREVEQKISKTEKQIDRLKGKIRLLAE